MKINLVLLFIVLFLIGIFTYFFNQTDPAVKEVPVTTTEEYEALEKVEDFKLTDISGTTYNLSDFKGKIIILNFWASWCTPCAVEFPQLLELSQSMPDKVIFIPISVDTEVELITRFLTQLKGRTSQETELSNVHYMWDPEKKISQDIFYTVKYPETYIIAPDFTLREKIIGASVDFSSDDFKAHLMNYWQQKD